MGRKSSHWIRSMVSIFLFAIVLFIAIYFFNPALSIKFFGIGYRMESQVSTALEDKLVDKFNLDREQVRKYLDTEEGKKAVIAIVGGIKKGATSLNNMIDQSDIKQFVEKITTKDTNKITTQDIKVTSQETETKSQDIKITSQEVKETESTL